MLDLHVWGSAFGLPSIDAECLAIITYLHNSLLPGAWRLIPSNDPSISPSNTLPALHHHDVWVSGYGPIVNYLTSKSLVPDLDANLTPAQKADRAAYGAYLAAHAAPLLDLSLYVSAANWAATTRPAYSALLPFPLTWTVPTLIRAEAVKRVDHLGFADMDSDFDPNGGLHLSTGRDTLPESFRRHLPVINKKTIQEEMTPEQAVAIRLYGLVEDCLSVVNDALKEGEDQSLHFFDGSRPSSLDCLAYGYLALMRDADVPRAFLKDWLTQKTPRLSKFIDSMAALSQNRGDLPLVEAEKRSTLGIGARTLDTICYHLPGVGDDYANEKRRRAEEGITGVDKRAVVLAMSAIATVATFSYGLYMYKALQPFGTRTQLWAAHPSPSKLSEFGELGSILGSAMGGYPAPMSSGLSGGRIVETDSELD